MATFSVDVYQNEYLPEGGSDVHAIVTRDLAPAPARPAVRVGRTPPRSSSSTAPAR